MPGRRMPAAVALESAGFNVARGRAGSGGIIVATRAGLRYARHAPELYGVLVRTVAFILCASALWALLPPVERRDIGLPSSGYGVLLASLGAGAVAGAGVLPHLRERLSADLRVASASVVCGAATLALGLIHDLPNTA